MILRQQDKTVFYDYCYINTDINYIYIPIPKNASMYMSRILHQIWNFTYTKISEVPDHIFNNSKKILILRDPINRWVTGASHYLYRLGYEEDPKLIMDELFNQISFDVHTASQSERLFGLNLDHAMYFYYDNSSKNPLDKIKKYLHKTLGGRIAKEYNLLVYDNSIDKIPQRLEFKKAIMNHISENPNLLDQLKLFFKDDYALISKVKFYD